MPNISHPELIEIVSNDLRSPDAEAKAAFFKEFGAAEKQFAYSMVVTLDLRSTFMDGLDDQDERARVVAAILFTALNHNISSYKLFMTGYTVASGCLFRQVLEGISLALLCSAKSLSVLDRFMEDKYSPNGAVSEVAKQASVIRVKPKPFKTVQDAYKFYHKYAHLSKLTIAAGANFSQGGLPNVGAYFDPGKLLEYRKEVKSRVGFSQVLPSTITLIAENVSAW